jgi:hypothetical protein
VEASSGNDDSFSVVYRSSTDSDGESVAHISFLPKYTGMVYEIVGPASSLDDESFFSTKFTAWKDVTNSCPSAHSLPETLAYYASAYVSDETTWSKATGLNTPQMIRMSISASSTASVQGAIDLVTTVTKGQATASTTSYSDDACDITTITLSGDQNLPVIYVVNNAEFDNLEHTIADWEQDAQKSHGDWLSGNHIVGVPRRHFRLSHY